MLYWNLVTVREFFIVFYFAMNPYLFLFSTDPFCSVWCHAVSVVVTVLVVRSGHWVCGESWHAIKGSLTHRPSSQGWAPGVLPLCVSMCMFGGFV